ncbi:hypothetical protein A1F94_000871 [Pyrenophora tritici-repentis]|uniref:Uncharacterized protein n=2 Tax=Pyrenophora tritici-repentis TaxID=45151 RepID=A0A2W1FFG9_9PLEO|nr:uncharacterized protein PTRG_01180 [Pyrenophora tritici-repentis Pt-1C-BFP]KAF7454228.1 hypothetical protein A1F99_014860 [Pyrenophora tritici-repentis]EDU40618.1 hypothetical protein PTRG_01180 [Pyrenophora tritici-repentis Pt-1C-BFP]KAF7577325.1 hypothetical protein PtrM4_015650 [Pyrenophora tritici-repentis]KAG9387979.1 hypothetical protein A1F94_000871 [Pyrenophora tritici-repentis]KAI0570102.1 hypothetical protein Alg215_11261 [Pyrenophora tritici-repentis]
MAPSSFRDGKYHIFMQERYLKKWWKVEPDDLAKAGVKVKESPNTTTQAKKFALYHVWEYVQGNGIMNRKEADEVLEIELKRIEKTRQNYRTYQSGGYSGGCGWLCECCD